MLYKQKLLHEDPDGRIVGYPYFLNIFHELKLAIHIPKKDQCSYCNQYKDEHPEWVKKHISLKYNVKELHDTLKIEVKEDPSLFLFNFDLEAVLYTPGEVSTLFYKRKFNTFNFTMYDLGTSDGYCYVGPVHCKKRFK